jgi:hypothetical protein
MNNINPANKTKADNSSSPNPILDSPFGMILAKVERCKEALLTGH